jgi:hypothetical protein
MPDGFLMTIFHLDDSSIKYHVNNDGYLRYDNDNLVFNQTGSMEMANDEAIAIDL